MRYIVLTLLLFARIAHADVGVVVTGEPVLQAPVMAQVQGWLQEHKYILIAAPLGTMNNTFIDCFVIEDMACARGVFEKQSKAASLVLVRVELQAGKVGREYVLTAYWFVKEHDAVVDKRLCSQCDDAALSATVDSMMSELLKSSGVGKGRIKITSIASGVIVMLDGVKLGAAPIERDLEPGPHVITFMHHGESVGERKIAVEPGAVLEIAAPTVWDDRKPPPPPAEAPSRVIPGLLLGGGVAAGVAGGVFLYYGSLGGPDEPYVYTNATAIGVPLTIVGAAGIIAGAVLWSSAPTVRGDSKPPPPEARSRVIPGLLLGGGAIAAVAGGVFLYYGTLGGPDEPYVYTNATEVGVPLTIAGAAGIIAGVVLWFRGAPSASTPTVSITSTSANVGWRGSF